jgi:hypothetical protein
MRLPSLDLRPLLAGVGRLVEGWKAFWFTPADPTVLGLIRIGAGAVLVYVLAASTPLLEELYGPRGWVDLETADVLRRESPWAAPPAGWDETAAPPVVRPELSRGKAAEAYRRRWGLDPGQTIDTGMPLFSPWFHVTDPRGMRIVHALGILVAVLFALGLASRVTSVLAWVVALGYFHRAPETLFGMDTILAVLLLYLMIGPCGSALSLDALIRRRPPAPSVSANVALRLMQVHFCLIYLASGASKLQGPAWWNGTALWQTLSNYEFAPARFAFFTELLRWLTAHRVLWEVVHSAGSAFTLALELGLPFLIWYPRWRGLMIAGAVVLHTGIALTTGLTAFSLLMIVLVASFLPPPGR